MSAYGNQGRDLEAQEARAFGFWAAVPLFTAGFLAPAPFIAAAAKTGRRAYVISAAVWSLMVALCVVFLVLGGNSHANDADSTIGGFLIFGNMLGATVHTLAVRKGVAREIADARPPELASAERSAAVRRRAREMASRDPRRALELGVGRPDVAGSFDGGLIDVNHAPIDVLTRLPGIDEPKARRIAELRMSGNGFVSAEDLDMVLDLEPGVVAEIATRAVFLPRF